MNRCSQCEKGFEVTGEDRDFYDRISPTFERKKYSIPDPLLCPFCRQQRRRAFSNRRQLYKRPCDFTRKNIISIYSSDKPFKVYNKDVWYSDRWDPMDYGRDFDFSRPFFPQFRELMEVVPVLSLALLGTNVNSDYNNDAYDLKNCYLIFDGANAENAYYGEGFSWIKNAVDFLFLEKCEIAYECVHCENSYNLKFSRYSKNCSDSWFLRDCIGCRYCFGCTHLKNKEFYIFNKSYSKEDYEKFMSQFRSENYRELRAMQQKVETFFRSQPVPSFRGIHNENALGDNINHCKNAFFCFNSNRLEDCRYVTDDQVGSKDCWDIDIWCESIEFCYNSCNLGLGVRNVLCSYYVSEGSYDVLYSFFCSLNSHHLFGCAGLRHQQYCILNKPHSPAEYEKKAAQIIEHMQHTGEWGQFFPPNISPFAYNETVAQDYFPMTSESVLARGWKWFDHEPKIEAAKTIAASRLPDDIKEIPDDVLNWAIACEVTDKPFKITAQELKFYRDHQLPLPHLHPDERHRQRMTLQNPHRFWNRSCSRCQKPILTNNLPEQALVYCQSCASQSLQ